MTGHLCREELNVNNIFVHDCLVSWVVTWKFKWG